MNWFLVQNSLLTASLATLVAVLFGVIIALCSTTISNPRMRGVVFACAIVPLLWPPFLVLNCWLNLLGETGVWRSWFPFSVLSIWGTVWVLALMKWPITFLFVTGALGRLDWRLVESDMRLKGGALLRWVVWPQIRAAVALSALITFVLGLTEFSIPSILQVKVFTTEVWINFNTTFNYGAVLKESWPLVVIPLLFLLLLRGRDLPLAWRGYSSPNPCLQTQFGWVRKFTSVGAILVFGFSVFLPVGQLLLETKTWRELGPAWLAGTNAMWHSVLYAGGGAMAALLLGTAFLKSRLGRLLWLPFFLPGVLLGIALSWGVNLPILRNISQSGLVVIFAFGVRYGAVAWMALHSWLRITPANLREDAELLGAGRWFRFRHVFWPAHGQRVVLLAGVVYLLALWDVETLIMIVPAGGETLALRIFNLLHYGHNGQVNALCVVLLAAGWFPMGLAALIGPMMSLRNKCVRPWP